MKKTIMSLLLFLGVLSASAQAEQKGTTEYVFQPHWYITLQGGGQYTLGEGKFGDLLSPTAQIGVGYNFTKVVGLRLAVNAWQSKGVIKLDDNDIATGLEYEGKWKWNYVAPSLEFTFNLSNIVCNYNPNRLLNVYALIGGGANIAFKNDEAQDVEKQIAAYQNTNWVYDGKQNMRYLWDGTKVRPFGKVGLLFDFRVSDKVSINIEGNANTLSDKYNSKKAGNWDWYFNALAGVKINLGKTYTTKFTPDPEPEIRYVEKVVEKVVEVPAKVEVKPIEKMRRDIFFTINSFKVRDTEAEKIKDIADYLNANPRAKVEVTGYADAGTGNNRINDRLAKQRADVVVKTLMNDYNISANRIFFDSKGSRVQPFAENDLNRVTICIAE
jgi:outer membrane protein OmpA-like peptidoglycan-associated protein